MGVTLTNSEFILDFLNFNFGNFWLNFWIHKLLELFTSKDSSRPLPSFYSGHKKMYHFTCITLIIYFYNRMSYIGSQIQSLNFSDKALIYKRIVVFLIELFYEAYIRSHSWNLFESKIFSHRMKYSYLAWLRLNWNLE